MDFFEQTQDAIGAEAKRRIDADILENLVEKEKEKQISQAELNAKAVKDYERAAELGMSRKALERHRGYYLPADDNDTRCIDCAGAWTRAQAQGEDNYNISGSTCPKCGTTLFISKTQFAKRDHRIHAEY